MVSKGSDIGNSVSSAEELVEFIKSLIEEHGSIYFMSTDRNDYDNILENTLYILNDVQQIKFENEPFEMDDLSTIIYHEKIKLNANEGTLNTRYISSFPVDNFVYKTSTEGMPTNESSYEPMVGGVPSILYKYLGIPSDFLPRMYLESLN